MSDSHTLSLNCTRTPPELFTIEDFQNSATQLQLQSLHAAQRRSDKNLDEHIAFLHSLRIAGISDHDLMYTRDLSVKEELDVIKDSHYIQQRVQKAQFLVECESQNTELLMERQKMGNEGIWLREPVYQTKKKHLVYLFITPRKKKSVL